MLSAVASIPQLDPFDQDIAGSGAVLKEVIRLPPDRYSSVQLEQVFWGEFAMASEIGVGEIVGVFVGFVHGVEDADDEERVVDRGIPTHHGVSEIEFRHTRVECCQTWRVVEEVL